MKTLHVSVLASLFAVAPLLPAQTSTESSNISRSPGGARAEHTVKTTATVVGIVPATRTISLKRADGRIIDIQAGDEVRNFDKIKVGDKVTAQYTQALSLNLEKGGSAPAKGSGTTEVTRAPVGAQPGGKVGTQVDILADVVAVDPKNKVVTLRGPQGNLVDLEVQDPDQLKRVKKGDQVRAVYSEALAIAVEPASTSAPGK
ncbi:hypothetical protein [Massilia horti]|uniref:DUF5666 domain-containing protein n=1 Tax=Massilia horti TaxID=2562153 RepID=A0A4Y9T0E3_9BURK|nr:hypothetical protein [Massilia horti]TFW32224.1 hypothetical protein E4O92_10410 [Massilia horti]